MYKIIFCLKIGVPTRKELKYWGDYYLAKSLKEELIRKGHHCFIQILPEWNNDKDHNADVVIHFRGLSPYVIKPHHFNIMWNISHPNEIRKEEYEKYDLVLVSSQKHANYLRQVVTVPIETFLQFTDTSIFRYSPNLKFHYPILFVGNSRGVHRPIVNDTTKLTEQLAVIGSGWKGKVEDKHIKGTWYPNEKLHELYSSCEILLNDHWEDMRELGFINNRFFDAIACKSIVINDHHSELKELFPEALTYSNVEDLRFLLQDINGNRNKYKIMTENLYNDVVNNHTVTSRVELLLSVLEKYNFETKKKSTISIRKLSMKKKINQGLLNVLGYGKIYRMIHRIYITCKNKINSLCGLRTKIKQRFFNSNNSMLMNFSSESEIKALAQNKASVFKKGNVTFLVSVIIPSLNGEKYLRELIPSFIKNTLYSNYEVLIIDNNSKDGTKKYINSLENQKIKYFNTEENLNFSESINFGVKKSTGDYLVFLNNDVMPLYGWLDEMLRIWTSINKPGVVGARLVYNKLKASRLKIKEVVYPGTSVQHEGIKFKWTRNGVVPFNIGKYENPLNNNNLNLEAVPAVTAACLLTERTTFDKVKGFNEKYIFGREDVDFCLKVKNEGLNIVVARNSLLLHREFSSQIRKKHGFRKASRGINHLLFNEIWGGAVATAIWEEKILSQPNYWATGPLNIAFLVTENDPFTTAGDYFSARGLGEALKSQYGYKVSYLARRPENEWLDIPETTDLVVSMLYDCNFKSLRIPNGALTIAWIRGFLDDWKKTGFLNEFDGIIVSSMYAQKVIKDSVDSSKIWGILPLAVNSTVFRMDAPDKIRDIDICFVGNIFQVPRDIVTNLEVNDDINFHFYGRLEPARKNHPWNRFHKGSIPYLSLPELYQKSKIVIEDIAPFNRGTINLRIYESMASGALVIANDVPEIKETFGEHVIVYSNKEQLNSLIRYYLVHNNEREKIALAAKEFVYNKHTFFNRAKNFKELLENNVLLEDKILN